MEKSNRLAVSKEIGVKNALELFRVGFSESWYIRTLSSEVYGCLVHWRSDRSQLCAGDACPPSLHRNPLWKGYTSVLVYLPKEKCWLPSVWELTSACELDVRGRLDRGQEWLLSRGPKSPDSKPPVTARLVTDDIGIELPPALPVDGVLHNVFAAVKLPKSIRSPMPDRVLIDPVSAGPPLGELLKQDAERKLQQEAEADAAKGRAKLQEYFRQQRNGTH